MDRQELDFKKKRQKFAIDIRKNQREQLICRRRNIGRNGSSQIQQNFAIDDDKTSQSIPRQDAICNFENIVSLAEMLKSQMISDAHQGAIGLRKLLTTNEPTVTKKIIQLNTLPYFLKFANQNEHSELKLESIWAMSNLAASSSKICCQIQKQNGLPLFASVLEDSNLDIAEQAVWMVGNMSADSVNYRNQFLLLGALQKIINFVKKTKKQKQITNGIWAITNLIRGKPLPKYELIKPAMPIIAEVLKQNVIQDPTVISDCLWSLNYLIDGPKHRNQRLLETGVMAKIFEYLHNPYPNICMPALRIIGNFSVGNEMQTDELINNNIFNLAVKFLDDPKKVIRREFCWLLSNIASSTDRHVLQLLMHEKLIYKLVKSMQSQIPEIRVEICWIFSNFSRASVPLDILNLFKTIQLVRHTGSLLHEKSEFVIVNALDCLYQLFEFGESVREEMEPNLMKMEFISQGFVSRLEDLQYHESTHVYKCSKRLIENFFKDDSKQIGQQ